MTHPQVTISNIEHTLTDFVSVYSIEEMDSHQRWGRTSRSCHYRLFPPTTFPALFAALALAFAFAPSLALSLPFNSSSDIQLLEPLPTWLPVGCRLTPSELSATGWSGSISLYTTPGSLVSRYLSATEEPPAQIGLFQLQLACSPGYYALDETTTGQAWSCAVGDGTAKWLRTDGNTTRMECAPCPVGFACPGPISGGQRVACPLGHFASSTGQTKCSPCTGCKCSECSPRTGVCVNGAPPGCSIEGQCFKQGEVKPNSLGCAVCNTEANQTNWYVHIVK